MSRRVAWRRSKKGRRPSLNRISNLWAGLAGVVGHPRGGCPAHAGGHGSDPSAAATRLFRRIAGGGVRRRRPAADGSRRRSDASRQIDRRKGVGCPRVPAKAATPRAPPSATKPALSGGSASEQQVDEDDDRDRHADQPEQDALHGRSPSVVIGHAENVSARPEVPVGCEAMRAGRRGETVNRGLEGSTPAPPVLRCPQSGAVASASQVRVSPSTSGPMRAITSAW